MSKKPARNIYQGMYSTTTLVIILFFAHNIFENLHYDVLHIEYTYYFTLFSREYVWHVHDIFPFYDAPTITFYGDVPRYDLQTYIHRLSVKLIMLALMLERYRLTKTLNFFLSEIPGRKFVRMPYLILVLIALFSYELLDFIFFAARTNWIYEMGITIAALVVVCVVKKDKDARYK